MKATTLPEQHPNLSDALNRQVAESAVAEGADLKERPVGAALAVRTRNTNDRIERVHAGDKRPAVPDQRSPAHLRGTEALRDQRLVVRTRRNAAYRLHRPRHEHGVPHRREHAALHHYRSRGSARPQRPGTPRSRGGSAEARIIETLESCDDRRHAADQAPSAAP